MQILAGGLPDSASGEHACADIRRRPRRRVDAWCGCRVEVQYLRCAASWCRCQCVRTDSILTNTRGRMRWVPRGVQGCRRSFCTGSRPQPRHLSSACIIVLLLHQHRHGVVLSLLARLACPQPTNARRQTRCGPCRWPLVPPARAPPPLRPRGIPTAPIRQSHHRCTTTALADATRVGSRLHQGRASRPHDSN